MALPWKKEYPLNDWLKNHKLNSNYKVYAYPTEAKKAGYCTASELKTIHKIKDFDKSVYDAIVPVDKIGITCGLSFTNSPYLGIKEGKHGWDTDYYVPTDFYSYYDPQRIKKEQESKNSIINNLYKKEVERRDIIPPYNTQNISEKIGRILKISDFENNPELLQLTVQKDWWNGIDFPNYINPNDVNYVLSVINWGMIFRRQKTAPIKARYLQNVIHWTKQKKTINWMEQVGLISCDHQRIEKKKCFHYWIGERIKNNAYMSVWASEEIVERRKKVEERRNKKLTRIQKIIKSQMKYITIEEQNALLHCDEPSQQFIVESINKKTFRFDPDKHGRCHTNITNMNKESRKFLKIDNEYCDEPDVGSCQILLLAKLAKDEQIDGSEELLRLCECGEFYEAFPGDRDKNKSKIITELLFGEYAYTLNSKVCKVFRDKFPLVYDWLIKIKKHNYKELSHRLQNYESKIMIDLVGNALVEKGIHFHPIYDSILCKKSDTVQVVEVMREVFQSQGMNAHVKVKAEIFT